jgi:hypothetical protein
MVLVLFGLFCSVACYADDFFQVLKELEIEATVQKDYFNAMGKRNYNLYLATKGSKATRWADQIGFTQVQEMVWTGIAYEIRKLRLDIEAIGQPIYKISSIQSILLHILYELDEISEGSMVDIEQNSVVQVGKRFRESNTGNKIQKRFKAIRCSKKPFPGFDLCEDYWRQLLIEHWECFGMFCMQGNRDFLQFHEEYVGSVRFMEKLFPFVTDDPKKPNYFEVKRKLLNFKSKLSGLSPGLGDIALAFSNAVMSNSFSSEIRNGSLDYQPGLEYSTFRISSALYPEILNIMKEYIDSKFKDLHEFLNRLGKTESSVHFDTNEEIDISPIHVDVAVNKLQLNDTENRLIEAALDSSNSKACDGLAINYRTVLDLVTKLGGGEKKPSFGTRLFVRDLNPSDRDSVELLISPDFLQGKSNLCGEVRYVLGNALRRSGWHQAWRPLAKNNDVNVDSHTRANDILKEIDLDQFIPLSGIAKSKNAALSPVAVTQYLFYLTVGRNPSFHSQIEHCPDSFFFEQNNIGVCRELPVEQVSLASKNNKDSVTEFLVSLNSFMVQAGKPLHFRLATLEEYRSVALLNNVELMNKWNYLSSWKTSGLGSVEMKSLSPSSRNQTHSVRAKLPNSLGFYHSSVLEWLNQKDSRSSNCFTVIGSSFAELEANCDKPVVLDSGYSHKDIGFRLVVEKD